MGVGGVFCRTLCGIVAGYRGGTLSLRKACFVYGELNQSLGYCIFGERAYHVIKYNDNACLAMSSLFQRLASAHFEGCMG